MLRMTLDPADPDPIVVARAARAIIEGLIVAYPTDTLYGLAVDPHDPVAVDRLFEAKGRPRGMPVPLIAGDLDQAFACASLVQVIARRLAERFWPGPLTLVMQAVPGLVAAVHAGTNRVGVRVPGHAVARALARHAGRAITATSANRSGEPAPADPDTVARTLEEAVAVLLDGGSTAGGPPSTVVDVTGQAPVLVREGVVPWARVLESI
jgi:L-threonylcarbamoyladenylate synthase